MGLLRRIKKLLNRNERTHDDNFIEGSAQNELEKRVCQVCRFPYRDIYKIRKFDYQNLPTEYFYHPSPGMTMMIVTRVGYIPYPDTWIHLPYDKRLTGYDTRCCYECYAALDNIGLDPWNYWKSSHNFTICV